jgi:L-seryl-tRNA(Ser) seleniumtransferase
MATKTSDLLNNIPSVSELLERPQVRALVERWNRSVVAGGVRSFLDELTQDLHRRAKEAGLPPLRELAERAARYVVQLQQPALRPAINATGRLLDPAWGARPLADGALERMVVLGRGFVEPSAQTLCIGRSLARLAGAEAATATHSYAGAISLVLSTLAAGKEFVIASAETGDVEPSCDILTLAAAVGAHAREVGCANRAGIADYERGVNDQTAGIVRHLADGHRLLGDLATAEMEELVAVAREREVPLVCAIGSAPLVRGLPLIGESILSVAATLAAGANLVIVRGDGLVGGPTCGLIVGQSDLVRQIEELALFKAWELSALPTAALLATLDLYDDQSHLVESLPWLRLLSVSVDNLRLRAERIAPQLGQADGIQGAEPIATENGLGPARFAGVTWPSYGIALTSSDGDGRMLEKRLRSAPVPVIGRLDGSRIVLDLRTVFPRQDQQIVELIAGGVSAPAVSDVGTTATN